jgi:hypothetical protein
MSKNNQIDPSIHNGIHKPEEFTAGAWRTKMGDDAGRLIVKHQSDDKDPLKGELVPDENGNLKPNSYN